MRKKHENMILTPDKLREKYELEDGPQLIELDWEGYLIERRLFDVDTIHYRRDEHDLYRFRKSQRKDYYEMLKDRQRKLEMKISEDYWSAKPPMSPIRGKDFGLIFKN